jgi:hypothetical protein
MEGISITSQKNNEPGNREPRVISQTLADRANALARERTLADVFDRDQRTKSRLG